MKTPQTKKKRKKTLCKNRLNIKTKSVYFFKSPTAQNQRLKILFFPLAPFSNKVALCAGPNNLWTCVGAARKKTEHVTVIKCVLLLAVWQAPKYNSERKADRRPDGIGSRYLSEINRMLFVSLRETTETVPIISFDPLQRDFTVTNIRVFARDQNRTSKCASFSYLAQIWSYDWGSGWGADGDTEVGGVLKLWFGEPPRALAEVSEVVQRSTCSPTFNLINSF